MMSKDILVNKYFQMKAINYFTILKILFEFVSYFFVYEYFKLDIPFAGHPVFPVDTERKEKKNMARIIRNRRIVFISLWPFNQSEAREKIWKYLMKRKRIFVAAKA